MQDKAATSGRLVKTITMQLSMKMSHVEGRYICAGMADPA